MVGGKWLRPRLLEGRNDSGLSCGVFLLHIYIITIHTNFMDKVRKVLWVVILPGGDCLFCCFY